MNKDDEFQYYLSLSPNKFGIYLFDTKNLKNLYNEEVTFSKNLELIDEDALKKFLDKNIFKIEKLTGKFIENIFLVYENNKILNLEFGIKKKNYNNLITRDYLKNVLIEAKDLFRENYQDQVILHMIINKYFIDEMICPTFEQNLKGDHLALEINIKSIPNYIINHLSKILENYQIKIIKYIDGNYLKNNFSNEMELAEKSYRILCGHNQNEVIFVPKNTKKLAFFEKFFQLFS